MSVQLHAIKNKEKKVSHWVAITKMVSNSSPHEWKNNDQFYSCVSENKTYIFPHPFGQDDWDIVSIGFIKNIHAVHYPRDLLKTQITEMLDPQTNTVPTFQLIPQRITTADKSASTKAYSVQCRKDDGEKLLHLLTHGPFREAPNQIFVPFKYKRTKLEIFLKCIRQQNDMYYKTWIIKAEGITQEAMKYIEHDITRIMGVWHIVPSKRMEEIGEWKILTDHTKCAYIHRQLSQHWSSLIDKIPQEVLEDAPINFSTPMISSKRAREYQDNDSDKDSYGSLLTTATEISAMTAEDNALNDPPVEYQYSSYANAVMASNNSGEETQVSSPTASIYPEWLKEKQELEEQVRQQALQIEKIQADLQAKISRSQDLEDKLAQAIELAHSRDARHEEMLAKFEQLLSSHSLCRQSGDQEPSDTDMIEANSPATPERKETTSEAPPPKKANTNVP